MPSSPHEYESVSETDIQMNQLERNTEEAVNYMEDDEEEDNDEEEVDLNIGTPPSQVHDAEIDSAGVVHSQLISSGNYSSLMGRQTTQNHPTTYSQLVQLATVLPVVPDIDEENNMEQSEQHTYYNVQ